MTRVNPVLFRREIEFEGVDGQAQREVQEFRLSDALVIVAILIMAYLYRSEFIG
jgi:hypothetical protein